MDIESVLPFISLPWAKKGMQVEVTVTPQEKERLQEREVTVESMEGCLHKYANPALWKAEKHAWENHVIEKYGNI